LQEALRLLARPPGHPGDAPERATTDRKIGNGQRVELELTGSSTEWQVERRAGSGQFENLAPAHSAGYIDESIRPNVTYHYRVRNQAGAASNEVVAGPPPAGVTSLHPCPPE
jgi:hypothetical protein